MDADSGAKGAFAPADPGHQTATFREIVPKRGSLWLIVLHMRVDDSGRAGCPQPAARGAVDSSRVRSVILVKILGRRPGDTAPYPFSA
jgi:hypothetical protein